ncbi:trichohyalin-like, partial [Mercenaria mercenaria]|uniref:trichohyalin-like n=1 Tax=Mercenaria mercenaria TaxID=6596 RepID=UPI00234F7E4F
MDGAVVRMDQLSVLQKDNGYHTTFDNLFSSMKLTDELARLGIACTGTTISNRIENCPVPPVKDMQKKRREMEPFDIQTVPEKVHATQEENIYERRQKYSNVKPTAFSKVGTDRAIGERQPIESLLIDARRDALENKACYDVRSAELNAKVQEDTISDSDHVKFALERNEQFELLVSANEKLQAENSELKRQKESLEDEKHNINKKKNRQIMKNESCQPLIKQQKIKIVRLMDEMDTKRKTTKQEVGKIDRRVKEKDTHLDKHEHSREDLQKRERRQNQTQENDVYRLIREKYRQGTELENEQERILHDYGIVKEKMQQNNEKLQLVSKKHLSALVRCEDAIKQVEFEKMLLDTEYNILAHSLCKVEEDNAILANAVQDLQAKLSKSKQEHAQ